MSGRPVTASLTSCGQRFTVEVGNWRGSEPIDALPDWIGFYRRMRDRKGGIYARHYQPTLDALEALQRQLRAAS